MEGFLTKKQREELKTAHRHESLLRYGDRIKAVLLLDAGWSRSQIAEVLLIDESTVRRYFELYQLSGVDGLCNDNYHGRRCVLTEKEQESRGKGVFY